MRGAGCTVNDMWDGRIDAQVTRTRDRPLASGRLTYTQAGGWLAAQLGVGLGVVLSLNVMTVAWSFAIIPLVVIYPLCKRVMAWPQVVLGLCFNWGAVVGYTAGACELAVATVVPLYTAGILWTLVYDTIYAHQDTVDDRALGLYSTALYFGEKTHVALGVIGGLMVAALGVVGWGEGMGGWYYVGVGGVAAHLIWQMSRLDVRDRAGCWRLFVSNRWIGWILLSAIVVDKWMMARDEVKEREREEKIRRSRESIWGKTGYEVIREFMQGDHKAVVQPAHAE